MDWTDNYSRKKISDYSNVLVEELIREIHAEKLTIHTEYSLTKNELGILYRWALYVGVNTFVERLIRTFDDKNRGVVTHYDADTSDTEYYTSMAVACSHYYNGILFNSKLLNTLSNVISDGCGLKFQTVNLLASSYQSNTTLLNKRQYTFKSGIRFTKRTIISFYLLFMRLFAKPDFIYEDTKNLNIIFPVRNRFQELPYKKLSVNSQTRGKLKEIFQKVFLNNQDDNLVKVDKEKNEIISKVFSEWIDHVLPLSIVEGLSFRLNYYQNLLSRWDIKQIHSSFGYSYNDNLKCFSVLAKRKNAKIICQNHGINNFLKLLSNKRDVGHQYKYLTAEGIVNYSDYYMYWGAGNRSPGDVWDDVERVYNTKIINSGSVYLSTLKKWKKSITNSRQISLFYICGPSRTFMASLQENTPEKYLIHRKNVLEMLKNLLDQNFNLKILYKTFMGIDLSNDPIIEILSEYFDQGRVKLTNAPPIELMPEVDIAFFDMISTGFAEAIQIGVPTLVYSNEFDYELTSNEGKTINDELENCGIVFYDTESGIESFERIVNDLNGFQQASKEPIRRFQEAVAYPVSKKKFLKNMDTKITSANSEV